MKRKITPLCTADYTQPAINIYLERLGLNGYKPLMRLCCSASRTMFRRGKPSNGSLLSLLNAATLRKSRC